MSCATAQQEWTRRLQGVLDALQQVCAPLAPSNLILTLLEFVWSSAPAAQESSWRAHLPRHAGTIATGDRPRVSGARGGHLHARQRCALGSNPHPSPSPPHCSRAEPPVACASRRFALLLLILGLVSPSPPPPRSRSTCRCACGRGRVDGRDRGERDRGGARGCRVGVLVARGATLPTWLLCARYAC